MRLFRKKYPRVVEFECGRFGIELSEGAFHGEWGKHLKSYIYKYSSKEEAIGACNDLNLNIKRQVWP